MVVPPWILLTFSQFSSQENRYFKVAFFFKAIFYKRRLNYFKLRDKAHLKFEWLKQNKKKTTNTKSRATCAYNSVATGFECNNSLSLLTYVTQHFLIIRCRWIFFFIFCPLIHIYIVVCWLCLRLWALAVVHICVGVILCHFSGLNDTVVWDVWGRGFYFNVISHFQHHIILVNKKIK